MKNTHVKIKKPILFIQQPKYSFDVKHQFQTEYRFKVDEQEFIEPDFMDEEIDESQRLDNNEQLKSKEEVDQKIEETELFPQPTLEKEAETVTNRQDQMEKQINQRKMKRLIKRLALYPNVIERPLCEAIVHGEKMVFEVISKRGNFVRIRNDRKIEVIHIDEISDLKVLD